MEKLLKLVDVLGLEGSLLLVGVPVLIGLSIVFFVKRMEKRHGKEKFAYASPTASEIRMILMGGLVSIAMGYLTYTSIVNKEPLYISILFLLASCFFFILALWNIKQFITRWKSLKK